MAERIKLKERKEIENSKRKKSRNAKVTENKEKKNCKELTILSKYHASW
jgi:hypothetical protein